MYSYVYSSRKKSKKQHERCCPAAKPHAICKFKVALIGTVTQADWKYTFYCRRFKALLYGRNTYRD